MIGYIPINPGPPSSSFNPELYSINSNPVIGNVIERDHAYEAENWGHLHDNVWYMLL